MIFVRETCEALILPTSMYFLKGLYMYCTATTVLLYVFFTEVRSVFYYLMGKNRFLISVRYLFRYLHVAVGRKYEKVRAENKVRFSSVPLVASRAQKPTDNLDGLCTDRKEND